MRRTLIVIGALVILTAAGVTYWRLSSGPRTSAPEIEGEVVLVSRGTVRMELSAGGNVALERKAPLRFKMRGRIEEISVKEGDRVATGQTLACLETFDTEKAVRRTEAEVSRAQAQLAKLQSGARDEEIASSVAAVTIAQANVRAADAVVDSAIAGVSSSEAAVSGAQASLDKLLAGPTSLSIEIAEKRLEQARNDLWAQQAQRDAAGSRAYADADREAAEGRVAASESQVAIAGLQLDELKAGPRAEDVAAARAQVAQAVAAVENAKANLAQARAQADVARAQVQQAEAQLALIEAGSRAEDVAATEAQVVQARAGLEESQLQIEEACLVSPFAGLVAKVDAQLGDLVETSQPVITVVDDAIFHVTINVDEADIGRVAVGQRVDLTLDAYVGATGVGEIVYISPLAQSDSGIVSFEVRVDITECDVPLREGLTVNANVVTQLYEDRLVVPNSAIMVDDETGDRYVARRTAAGTELVRIETGYYNDMVSEVLAGLEEGDTVLRRSTSYRERFREMMTGTFPGS